MQSQQAMLAAMRSRLAEPTLCVWGACQASGGTSDLAGYVSVALVYKPDPRQFYYVDELWVPAEYRRQGIALALVQAVLEEARSQGMWRVRLQAADTPAARALYLKAGFHVEPGGWAEYVLD